MATASAAMKCILCEDCGWVCEEHPTAPWNEEHLLRCNGAGAPYPWCNTPKDGSPPRMPEGFRTEADKGGWRH